MANHGKVAFCPYYISEQKQSITCEDTIRRHNTPEAKKHWMTMYCYSRRSWDKCPYAKGLNEIYEKAEHMSPREGEKLYLKYINEAQRTELNKLLSALGAAESKLRMGGKHGNQNRGPVAGDEGEGDGNREKKKEQVRK